MKTLFDEKQSYVPGEDDVQLDSYADKLSKMFDSNPNIIKFYKVEANENMMRVVIPNPNFNKVSTAIDQLYYEYMVDEVIITGRRNLYTRGLKSNAVELIITTTEND